MLTTHMESYNFTILINKALIELLSLLGEISITMQSNRCTWMRIISIFDCVVKTDRLAIFQFNSSAVRICKTHTIAHH